MSRLTVPCLAQFRSLVDKCLPPSRPLPSVRVSCLTVPCLAQFRSLVDKCLTPEPAGRPDIAHVTRLAAEMHEKSAAPGSAVSTASYASRISSDGFIKPQ